MELEKTAEAAGSRRYDDACRTADALEILGGRWALPIIRELMLAGPDEGTKTILAPAIGVRKCSTRLTS
jgi:DNA-binding HxlR family transcriptional regulator